MDRIEFYEIIARIIMRILGSLKIKRNIKCFIIIKEILKMMYFFYWLVYVKFGKYYIELKKKNSSAIYNL